MTSTTTPNIFEQIAATLEADAQLAVTWFQEGEQELGAFLSKVASGAQIVIADIEAVGQYIAAHLGVITSGIASLSTVAAAVAPNNVSVQKVLADLNTGAQDVAALSSALSSGSTAGDSTVVTTAVTAINAVKQLSGLVAQAGTTLTTLTANSATATQALSQTTAGEG